MKTFRSLIIFAFSLLCNSALGQGIPLNQVLFSSDDVIIEGNLTDCIDEKNGTAKQYQVLEIKNLTNSSITVSFKKQLWYGSKCISCNSESEEYTASVEVAPNGVVSGNCESFDKTLKVFVRMLKLKGVTQLTHFEILDVEITEL